MPGQRTEQFDRPRAERDRADVPRLWLPAVLGADVDNRMGTVRRDVGPGEVLEFAHPHPGLSKQLQGVAVGRPGGCQDSLHLVPRPTGLGPGFWFRQAESGQRISGEQVPPAGMDSTTPSTTSRAFWVAMVSRVVRMVVRTRMAVAAAEPVATEVTAVPATTRGATVVSARNP